MTDLYTAACRHVAEWRNRGAPAAETAAIVDGLLADLHVVVSVADHDGEWRRDAEMRAMVAERDLASATALYGVALKRAELAESEAGLRWRERAEAATAAARELAEALRAALCCRDNDTGEVTTDCLSSTLGRCPWADLPDSAGTCDEMMHAALARALLAKHAEVIR